MTRSVASKISLPDVRRLLEVELRLRFFLGELDDVHLVELLLSGHRHITRRDARFVAGNEVLQFRNFLLLALISGFQLLIFSFRGPAGNARNRQHSGSMLDFPYGRSS